MSYSTQVQLMFYGPDFFASYSDENIQPMLAEAAQAFSLSPPATGNPFYIDRVSSWFTDELLSMSGCQPQAEEFLSHMSQKFPGVVFGARGLGEEFEDLWVVFFRDGKPYKSFAAATDEKPAEKKKRGLFGFGR